MSLAKGRIDLVTKVKLRMLQSPVDTVVACMAITTSSSLGTGASISVSLETVGVSVPGMQDCFHSASLVGHSIAGQP